MCPVDPWAAVVALRVAGPTGEWGAAADPLSLDGHRGSTHLLAPEGLRGCVFVLLCDSANDVVWHRLRKAERHRSTAVWSPASAFFPLRHWATLNRVCCFQPWFYLPFIEEKPFAKGLRLWAARLNLGYKSSQTESAGSFVRGLLVGSLSGSRMRALLCLCAGDDVS